MTDADEGRLFTAAAKRAYNPGLCTVCGQRTVDYDFAEVDDSDLPGPRFLRGMPSECRNPDCPTRVPQ
jgi:hypothetical protein